MLRRSDALHPLPPPLRRPAARAARRRRLSAGVQEVGRVEDARRIEAEEPGRDGRTSGRGESERVGRLLSRVALREKLLEKGYGAGVMPVEDRKLEGA